MKIMTKTAKNGKTLYFLIGEDGKKTRVSQTKAEEILAAEKIKEEPKMNTNLKTTRYTKVHALGEDAPEIKQNIMDITVGAESCKAEATFTSVSTYKKAAYWTVQFLSQAKAEDILAMAAEELQARAAKASRDAAEVEIDQDNWSCTIAKVEKGVYKVQMNWRLSDTAAEKTPAVEKAEEAPKGLSFAAFMAMAKRCYMEGGKKICETWDNAKFDEYVQEHGPMTKKAAAAMFHAAQGNYGG